MRLSELQAALAPHGQMLALDPPGDPTIGACLAGDLSGPRRHRYGAIRDLVIGITVVLADGSVASAGGKVVKNVAGFDLGKLFCGSRGRLGLIARVALRLHPRPRDERTLLGPADRWQAVHRSQLDPIAADLLWPGRLALLVGGGRGFDGFEEGDDSVWHGVRRAAVARDEGSLGRRRVPARAPGTGDRVRRRPARRVVAAGRARTRCIRPRGSVRLMDPLLIRDCVHCGFCLPTCPTYELWHEEMDSPRGRIWLMQEVVEGNIELNATVAQHFDQCLGCMACLTSCPSGVKYDRLIELARERVEEEVRRPAARAAPPCTCVRSAAAPARDARCAAVLAARTVPRLSRACAALARAGCAAARKRRLWASASRASACSPAVCRACSSVRSTARLHACSPRTATR